jgi:hypothetical protein
MPKLPDVLMPIELDEDEILTVFGLNHFRALCRADGFTVVYNQDAGGYHLEQLSDPDSYIDGAVYDCEIDAFEDCCSEAIYDRVVDILGAVADPEVMIISPEFAVQMAARDCHLGKFKGLDLWYRSKENV